MIVLAGQRVSLGFFDVLDGHHAFKGKVGVDDQDFFQTVLVQQLAHFVLVGAFTHGDQTLFGRHHFADRDIKTVFEAYVAGRHDADQVAIVQHGYAGNVVHAGQFEQITNSGIGFNRDRVLDDTGLELLDLAHFGSLLLDGHVLVDDTDTAFLGHGNCQTGLGDCIHCSRDQRNIQLDATGQTGFQTDFVGKYLGITGHKENVVECKGFLLDTQHRGGSRAGNWKRAIIPTDPARLNVNLSLLSKLFIDAHERKTPGDPDVRRSRRETSG